MKAPCRHSGLSTPSAAGKLFCNAFAAFCNGVGAELAPLSAKDADEPADALLCAAAVAAPATAADEIMYMPAGLQSITPSQKGKTVSVQVMVDRDSAAALEAQRQAILSRTGKRPYFDFNHEDRAASFWPTAFFWRDGADAGVYARGEWSKSGREGIEGRDWRQFSPIFHVDNVRAKPARIVCNEAAKPNMGGLVNDAAFHTISPLWAKNAAPKRTFDLPAVIPRRARQMLLSESLEPR